MLATLDERFADLLDRHNARICPACGHEIGFGSLAWNNAATEAGTDYTTIEIICDVCQTEIKLLHSWEHASTTREVVGALEREWDADT